MTAGDETASDAAAIHQAQPVVTAGAPAQAADAALVLLHGRGASAESIVATLDDAAPHGTAILAPQAAHHNWYPGSYDAPVDANEPYLSSAVTAARDAVSRAGDIGVPPERTVVCGFSQGGCVAAEFAVRHPRRYGGVAVLAGALPGTPDRTPAVHGDLADTPVFLGVGADDPEIDVPAVEHTAHVLADAGGDVTLERYPDTGHRIPEAAVARVRDRLAVLVD